MFTPPPSPRPSRIPPSRPVTPTPSDASAARFLTPSGYSPGTLVSNSALSEEETLSSSIESKRRIARRTKWTILLVPAALILITISTRYLSHPAVFDALSAGPLDSSWHGWPSSLSDWHIHKRHPQEGQSSSVEISFPVPTPPGSPSVSASATVASGTADKDLPTIPESPPVLPTPFPRPLTAVNQNFSTIGCENFFNNMTSSPAFLQCRPLSLLIKTSESFIESQDNLTALNAIIWGTCNTNANVDQCVANMGWLATNLQSSCSEELDSQNTLVVQTLKGLQAYGLMRTAGCTADPNTNAYCYVEATHNTNPSDLYFYQLPLGTGLPSSTKPSCSGCTKSIMNLYAQSLNVSSLAKTYANAAIIANAACGAEYVQTATVIGSAMGRHVPLGAIVMAVVTLMSFWTLS